MFTNPSDSIFSFSSMNFSILENDEIGSITLFSIYFKMIIHGIKNKTIMMSVIIMPVIIYKVKFESSIAIRS